jgi:hypothetical protein
VPTVKNRMFQPLGIMLSDRTMLHIPSRAECEVAAAELDGPHLKAVLASGQLALLPTGADAERQPAPRHLLHRPQNRESPTAASATASESRRKARKG